MQDAGAPECGAFLGRGMHEPLAGRFQHHHPLGRVDEVEQLGPLHDVDDAAEFLIRVGGDAEDLLAAAARIEVLEQADDLAGQRFRQRLHGQAAAGRRAWVQSGSSLRGDDVVQLIDELEEVGRAVVARPRQPVVDHLANLAGVGARARRCGRPCRPLP